ncbi:MAG: hypothetical protein J07HQW2_02939 [Haloquadratum walsbyi J07HQW2]|uniref:Uncharacterized protein n=1 Tax=Haloquadratum walsbyi J07HQW2 TaxID=1238425 RepID=U1NH40_9EURY|nr:MAG: hypothetical protein J07HQW2_02939 [Haloquadratum walsbyi J07HQW2]
MGVLENPHLNADVPLGILRRLGWGVVHGPFRRRTWRTTRRRFLLDRDLFEIRVVEDGAVKIGMSASVESDSTA